MYILNGISYRVLLQDEITNYNKLIAYMVAIRNHRVFKEFTHVMKIIVYIYTNHAPYVCVDIALN